MAGGARTSGDGGTALTKANRSGTGAATADGNGTAALGEAGEIVGGLTSVANARERDEAAGARIATSGRAERTSGDQAGCPGANTAT